MEQREKHSYSEISTIIFLFFFPLITALLYFFGARYHTATLKFWRLEQGMFPVETIDAMFLGSFVLVSLSETQLVIFMLALVVMFFFMLVFIYLAGILNQKLEQLKESNRKNDSRGNKADELISKAKNQTKREIQNLTSLFAVSMLVCFAFALFSLLFLSVNGYAVTLAKKYALENMQEYDASLNSGKTLEQDFGYFSNIESFELDHQNIKGYVILCSSNYCGVYKGNDKRVVIPLSSLIQSDSSYLRKDTKTVVQK